LKVGIIGCGAIAARAHIPAFARAGAKIVAVADIELDRANRLAKKFNIPRVHSDYRELLSEDCELVSICTPPQTHASIAIDAAEAGKHILLEKPMATDLQDAEKIVSACKLNNIKLCMMHEYRFTPCVQEAKQRVSSGRLGEVLAVQMTAHPQFPMRWSDSAWLYEKWGMLDDVGVHYLDILSYLTEAAPRQARVVARDTTGKMGFFNYIQAVIELANSCVAYMDLSWVGGSFESSVRLFGTAGKIDMDVRNDHLAEYHGYITPLDEISATLRKSLRTTTRALTKRYFKGALIYHDVVIRSFLDSIARNQDPPVKPEEGKRVVEFLQLVKQAAG
jgi:predicted dehydrogenase